MGMKILVAECVMAAAIGGAAGYCAYETLAYQEADPSYKELRWEPFDYPSQGFGPFYDTNTTDQSLIDYNRFLYGAIGGGLLELLTLETLGHTVRQGTVMEKFNKKGECVRQNGWIRQYFVDLDTLINAPTAEVDQVEAE